MTGAHFATIGHSNRTREELVAMLHEAEVTGVADVRAFPRSRSNPVFNIEVLPEALAAENILYRHFPALGGRRGKQAGVDPETNSFWRERGFHNYADYTLGDDFAKGLAALVEWGTKHRVALMCSEAVWWRCHRRIITDHLLIAGHEVDHLLGRGQSTPAEVTAAAIRDDNGRITYPPQA